MNRRKIITAMIIIVIPIIYVLVLIAMVMGHLPGWSNVFAVMYYGFLLLLPLILGTLTVYISSRENVMKFKYRITAPWVPIFIIFVILACLLIQNPLFLLMILPIFMTAASMGGLIGGYIKFREEVK